MKQLQLPRILLAGISSGSGKTTVSCGILQALVNRNKKIVSYKCGPDYIDPMFHEKVIGTKSSNLDSFFFSPSTLKALLCKNAEACELALIEGVMGYYDGISFTSFEGSSYAISKLCETPTILIINAKGMAASAMALLKGFLDYQADHRIVGVIFNQVSEKTYESLQSLVVKTFSNRVKVFGYLPKMSSSFESRHLGLVTAEEIDDIKLKMQELAQQVEKTIDLDALMEVAQSASAIDYEPIRIQKSPLKIRIGIAKDKAFCFYYQDNLKLLEEMGAELIPFSPLTDDHLPANLHGLLLGGGYPELYQKELTQNVSMRTSILEALQNKLPCIAECGGFMYLNTAIEDQSMVQFLEALSTNTHKLTRFGYVELTAQKNNMLCLKGDKIRAHEFHYYDTNQNGEDFLAKKMNGKEWTCIIATDHLYAGFPHFHFYANLKFADNFYKKCLSYGGFTHD